MRQVLKPVHVDSFFLPLRIIIKITINLGHNDIFVCVTRAERKSRVFCLWKIRDRPDYEMNKFSRAMTADGSKKQGGRRCDGGEGNLSKMNLGKE